LLLAHKNNFSIVFEPCALQTLKLKHFGVTQESK